MSGELVYVPCRLKRDGDKQIMVIENAVGELIPVPRGGVEVVRALFGMVAIHTDDVPPECRHQAYLVMRQRATSSVVPRVGQRFMPATLSVGRCFL